MADRRLLELESTIKQLPGVLGCVILTDGGSTLAEIQAFARTGLDRDTVEALISSEAHRAGLGESIQVIHVLQLDPGATSEDRVTLQQAAEIAEEEARARGPITKDLEAAPPKVAIHQLDRRPSVAQVVLSSVSGATEAEVSLGGESQVVGQARGEQTIHGLRVVAEATLRACAKLLEEGVSLELRGASLVSVVGEEAVLVLVRLSTGQDLLGCALLRQGPASEATVRATLDAINRLITRD